MSESNKIKYFKITALLALLVTIIASPKLWHSNRSIPPVPVFDSFPSLPLWINYILLAGLIVFLVLSLFIKRPTVFLIIVLSLSVFLILFDLNRVLSPVYLFLCYLFILVLYYANKITYGTLLTIVRIMIFGIYLATGYCKLNKGFDPVIYQWLIAPLQNMMNESLFEFIKKCALVIPLTEMFIAIALVIPRIRKFAFFFILITHLTVLIVLSPKISITAFVIYPWNVSMMVMSFLFFYKAEQFSVSCLINSLKNNYVKLFVVLYIAFPFIHLFGYIPTNFAFEVYSGKRKYAYILFHENVYNKLPPDIKAVTRPKNVLNQYSIFLDEWIYADLRSSLYSEKRTIKFYKNYIMKITNSKSGVYLFIRQYNVDKLVY